MHYITKHPLCLGLDPGIGNTGWALVRRTATGYRLIDSGVITTLPRISLGKRLDQHFTRLHEILKNLHARSGCDRGSVFQSQYQQLYLDGFCDSDRRTIIFSSGYTCRAGETANRQVRSDRLR